MSKLKELIDELCPDGVEYKKIGEIAQYEQPTKYIVKSTDYSDDFKTPVLTAGQSFILGYTDETEGIYYAAKENPVIIFDDFTGAFKWVDFPFKVKSSAMKMITADNKITTLRYLFHLMGFLNYTSDEHKRLWISLYSEFFVPVPPLPVQREIVRILDSFTELTAELQAKLSTELTARKKQYEYYRDNLLTFDTNVPFKRLGDTCKMKSGKSISATEISMECTDSTPYPCFGGNGVRGYVANASHHGEYPLIGRQGALCGNVNYATGDFYATEHAVVVESKGDYQPRFLYYLLISMNLNQYRSQGAQPGLAVGNLENLVAPVPSLEVQNRIVNVLGNFDAICSDLNIGLPEEIEARQKQYEYYRDLLLSFDNSQFINVERERERERVGISRNSEIALLQYVFGYAVVRLGEIASVTRGGNFQKKDFAEDGMPCIHYGQIYTHFGVYADTVLKKLSEEAFRQSKKAYKNDIIMAVTSENIEDVCKCTAWLGDMEIAVSGHTAIIHHNQNAKYLSYYFHTSSFFAQKRKLAHGTKVIEVTPDKLNHLLIPLPPLEKQKEIVAILDRFDALCNDISEGLPAEIEARQKQYEYYRDKLLSFKSMDF